MSEIKYFLERKRDGPRELVAEPRGHAIDSWRDLSSNKLYFFLTPNNIKVDGPRQSNFI